MNTYDTKAIWRIMLESGLNPKFKADIKITYGKTMSDAVYAASRIKKILEEEFSDLAPIDVIFVAKED